MSSAVLGAIKQRRRRSLAEIAQRQDVLHINAKYIALDDLNFDWLPNEIEMFEQMWRDGSSVKQIADVLMRDPDEVVILAMDRARKIKIEARQCGLE